jgi:Polyketide cyclase / dehydrase and lipid transport
VWQVLTDLPAYPEWNPFIFHAEGRVRVGDGLTLRMRPVGGRAATLRPTVVEATAPTHLRWKGRLMAPKILDADHDFRIEALPDGRSRLTQDEHFSGATR